MGKVRPSPTADKRASRRPKLQSAIVTTPKFVPAAIRSPSQPNDQRDPPKKPVRLPSTNTDFANWSPLERLAYIAEHPPPKTITSYREWRLAKTAAVKPRPAAVEQKTTVAQPKPTDILPPVNLERQTIDAGVREHINQLVQGKSFDLLKPSILDQATISPQRPVSFKRLREVFAAPIPTEEERSALKIFRPTVSAATYKARQSKSNWKSTTASVEAGELARPTTIAANQSESSAVFAIEGQRSPSPALSIHADEQSFDENKATTPVKLSKWSDVSSDELDNVFQPVLEENCPEEVIELEDFTVVVVPSVHDRLGPPVDNSTVPSKVAKKLRRKQRHKLNKEKGMASE